MNQYYILPTCFIARNHKAGSTSLAKAIVTIFYPEMTNGHTLIDDMMWQAMAPQTENPDGDIMLLVRDPVERFCSAGGDISKLGSDDIHYLKQSSYVKYPDIKCYKFPDDLEKFCSDTGLSYPLPIMNESDSKRDISANDKEIAKAFYADDMELFKNI